MLCIKQLLDFLIICGLFYFSEIDNTDNRTQYYPYLQLTIIKQNKRGLSRDYLGTIQIL